MKKKKAVPRRDGHRLTTVEEFTGVLEEIRTAISAAPEKAREIEGEKEKIWEYDGLNRLKARLTTPREVVKFSVPGSGCFSILNQGSVLIRFYECFRKNERLFTRGKKVFGLKVRRL